MRALCLQLCCGNHRVVAVAVLTANESSILGNLTLRTCRFVLCSSPLVVYSWRSDILDGSFTAARCKSAVTAAASLVSLLAIGTCSRTG